MLAWPGGTRRLAFGTLLSLACHGDPADTGFGQLEVRVQPAGDAPLEVEVEVSGSGLSQATGELAVTVTGAGALGGAVELRGRALDLDAGLLPGSAFSTSGILGDVEVAVGEPQLVLGLDDLPASVRAVVTVPRPRAGSVRLLFGAIYENGNARTRACDPGVPDVRVALVAVRGGSELR